MSDVRPDIGHIPGGKAEFSLLSLRSALYPLPKTNVLPLLPAGLRIAELNVRQRALLAHVDDRERSRFPEETHKTHVLGELSYVVIRSS